MFGNIKRRRSLACTNRLHMKSFIKWASFICSVRYIVTGRLMRSLYIEATKLMVPHLSDESLNSCTPLRLGDRRRTFPRSKWFVEEALPCGSPKRSRSYREYRAISKVTCRVDGNGPAKGFRVNEADGPRPSAAIAALAAEAGSWHRSGRQGLRSKHHAPAQRRCPGRGCV